MNDEPITVIDIEPTEPHRPTESIQQSNWVSAAEAIHRSRLNKSAFQRAVTELTNLYYFPKQSLRRGEARNTQYSELAVAAIVLLKAGKLDRLRELQENSIPRSTSIVHVGQYNQVARAASVEASENLAAIDIQVNNLLNRFQQLGEALGDQAASQIEAAFTKKVAERIKKLTEV